MTFRKSLTNKIIPFVLALGIVIESFGCAGMRLEKRVKEISSQTMALPNVYPAQVNRLFSEIKGVYGNEFVRELKQIPEMQSDFTSEKINALEDIYSVGKEIQNVNSPNAKKAIEDIVRAGEDTSKAPLISVPLREWYRMHENKNGKWSPEYALNVLDRCWHIYENVPNGESLGVLNFLLWTNWKNLSDEDWKKWEEKGNEYVVLYKKNKDYLISDNQSRRLRYIPHTKAQTPEETRKNGGGDCENFAIEAAYDMEVLEKAGLYKDPKVREVWDGVRSINNKGHAFLTYKKNNENGIYAMDNARRTGIRKFASIEEAERKIGIEGGYNPKRIKGYGGLDWRTYYNWYWNQR